MKLEGVLIIATVVLITSASLVNGCTAPGTPADLSQTQFVGQTSGSFQAGTWISFQIQLFDSGGTKICEEVVAGNVTVVPGTNVTLEYTDGTGNYEVWIQLQVVGTATVSVHLDDFTDPTENFELIAEFEFTVNGAAFDPEYTMMHGGSGIGWTGVPKAGFIAPFTLSTMDSFGNIIYDPSLTVEFKFKIGGGLYESLVTTTSLANGNYDGTYWVFLADAGNQIEVLFNGVSYYHTVETQAGPAAAINTLWESGDQPSYLLPGGGSLTWYFQLRDSYMNLVLHDQTSIFVSASTYGSQDDFTLSATHVANGRYRVDFESTVPGSSSIFSTITKEVQGSYFIYVYMQEDASIGGAVVAIPPTPIEVKVILDEETQSTIGPVIHWTWEGPTEIMADETLKLSGCVSNTGDADAEGILADIWAPIFGTPPDIEQAITFSQPIVDGNTAEAKAKIRTSTSCFEHEYLDKESVCPHEPGALNFLKYSGTVLAGETECFEFEGTFSAEIDSATALEIFARGGSAGGCCGFDDGPYWSETSDVVSDWDGFTIDVLMYSAWTELSTPSVLLGCEDFTFSFLLNLKNLYQVDDIHLIITLPGELGYKSHTINPAPSQTDQSLDTDHALEVYWDQSTGALIEEDIEVTIVLEARETNLFDSTNVLSRFTGAARTVYINTQVTSANDEIDKSFQDPITISSHSFTKSYDLTTDNNAAGISPGDIVTWELTFQTSMYFKFGNFTIEDYLPDGLQFENSPAPSVTVDASSATVTYTANTDDVGNDADDSTKGTTVLTFKPSDALDNVYDPTCDGTAELCKSFTLTFSSSIRNEYTDFYQNGSPRPLFQGTRLENEASLTADVYEEESPGVCVGIGTTGKRSRSRITIPAGFVDSSIVAINGESCDTNPQCVDKQLLPTDTVTIQVDYHLPTSDVEDLCVSAFAGDILDFSMYEDVIFLATKNETAPPPGYAWFSADDTFFDISSIVPTINYTAGSDKIDFCFGDYDIAVAEESQISLVFTAKIKRKPTESQVEKKFFASSEEGSGYSTQSSSSSNTPYEVSQPLFTMTIALYGSSNPNSSPSNPEIENWFTSVGFTPPLENKDLPSDQDDGDAGDTTSVVAIISNDGNAPAYEIILSVDIPEDCFEALPSEDQLKDFFTVLDGCGDPVTFNATLNPEVEGEALIYIAKFPQNDSLPYDYDYAEECGAAIVVLFNITIRDDIIVGHSCSPTVETEFYTNQPSDNITEILDQSFTEDFGGEATGGTINFADPTLNLTFIENCQGTGYPYITIDETTEWTLEASFPEGILPNAVLSVCFDNKVTPVSSQVDHLGAQLNFTTSSHTVGDPGTWNADCYEWNFGTIWNVPNDDVTGPDETIRVSVIVAVSTAASNGDGDTIPVLGGLYWATDDAVEEEDELEIVEPDLSTSFTTVPDIGQAGDSILFTVTVDYIGDVNTDAHRIALSIPIDTHLLVDETTLACVDPDNAAIVTPSPSSILVELDSLSDGESLECSYNATIQFSVIPGTSISSTATVEWWSLDDVSCVPNTGRSYTDDDSNTFDIIQVEASLLVTNSCSADSVTPPDVGIGESFTYATSDLVPSGTVPQFRIIYYLENVNASLTILDTRVVTMGINIQNSLLTVGSQGTLSDRNSDGFDDTITFNFGDLQNLDGAPLDEKDVIVTEVTVAVMDDPINARGKTIYTYYETIHQTYSHSADSELTIQEPELLLDMTLVNTGPFEAGDIIQFDISVYHAPASYAASDIFLLDIMPAYLTLVNATSNVGTVVEGDSLNVTLDHLPVGDVLTVTMVAQVTDQIVTNSSPTDVGELFYRAADCEDVRPYNLSYTTPSVSAANYNVSFTYETCTPNITRGSVVTFVSHVAVPASTIEGVCVETTFPGGGLVEVLSRQLRAAPVGSNPNTTISDLATSVVFCLDETTVPIPGGIFEFEVVIKVLEVTSPQLTFTTDVAHDYSGEETLQISVDVWEMDLGVTLEASPKIASNGDEVCFEINVFHTAISETHAYRVFLTQDVQPEYQLITDSIVVPADATEFTYDADSFYVEVDILRLGDVMEITYCCNVVNTAADSFVSEDVGVNWGPDICDPAASTLVTDSLTRFGTVEIMEYDSCQSDSVPGTLYIGETFAIHVVMPFPSGTYENSILEVQHPFSTSIVAPSGFNIFAQHNISVSAPGVSGTDSDGDGVDDLINFAFGTIAALDYGLLIFEINGELLDHPNNTNGDTFTVNLTYSHEENGDTYSTTQSLEFSILEPNLVVSLDQNVTFLLEGVPVLFTVELKHTINSTGNAYSTTVLAPISEEYYVYIPGSINAPLATDAQDMPNGASVLYDVIPVGESRSFTFEAFVAPDSPIFPGPESVNLTTLSTDACATARIYFTDFTTTGSFAAPLCCFRPNLCAALMYAQRIGFTLQYTGDQCNVPSPASPYGITSSTDSSSESGSSDESHSSAKPNGMNAMSAPKGMKAGMKGMASSMKPRPVGMGQTKAGTKSGSDSSTATSDDSTSTSSSSSNAAQSSSSIAGFIQNLRPMKGKSHRSMSMRSMSSNRNMKDSSSMDSTDSDSDTSSSSSEEIAQNIVASMSHTTAAPVNMKPKGMMAPGMKPHGMASSMKHRGMASSKKPQGTASTMDHHSLSKPKPAHSLSQSTSDSESDDSESESSTSTQDAEPAFLCVDTALRLEQTVIVEVYGGAYQDRDSSSESDMVPLYSGVHNINDTFTFMVDRYDEISIEIRSTFERRVLQVLQFTTTCDVPIFAGQQLGSLTFVDSLGDNLTFTGNWSSSSSESSSSSSSSSSDTSSTSQNRKRVAKIGDPKNLRKSDSSSSGSTSNEEESSSTSQGRTKTMHAPKVKSKHSMMGHPRPKPHGSRGTSSLGTGMQSTASVSSTQSSSSEATQSSASSSTQSSVATQSSSTQESSTQSDDDDESSAAVSLASSSGNRLPFRAVEPLTQFCAPDTLLFSYTALRCNDTDPLDASLSFEGVVPPFQVYARDNVNSKSTSGRKGYMNMRNNKKPLLDLSTASKHAAYGLSSSTKNVAKTLSSTSKKGAESIQTHVSSSSNHASSESATSDTTSADSSSESASTYSASGSTLSYSGLSSASDAVNLDSQCLCQDYTSMETLPLLARVVVRELPRSCVFPWSAESSSSSSTADLKRGRGGKSNPPKAPQFGSSRSQSTPSSRRMSSIVASMAASGKSAVFGSMSSDSTQESSSSDVGTQPWGSGSDCSCVFFDQVMRGQPINVTAAVCGKKTIPEHLVFQVIDPATDTLLQEAILSTSCPIDALSECGAHLYTGAVYNDLDPYCMCAATNFQTTLLNAEQLVPVKEPESVSTVDSSVGSTVENPDSSFDSRPQEPKGKGPSANSEHSHAPIMELDKPVLADITQNEESAHHNRGFWLALMMIAVACTVVGLSALLILPRRRRVAERRRLLSKYQTEYSTF